MSLGGGNQTTTSKVVYTPQQKQAIDAAMPTLMNYLKNPPTVPNINTVLPFNQVQQGAQAGALQQAAGPLAGFTSGMMNASNFLNTGALDPNSNPWLKATAEAAIKPVTEQFTQSVLPNIRSSEIMAGQYGGTRGTNAQLRAATDYTRTALDTTNKIYSDAYESGMDRMVKNLALAPQTASLSLYPWQVAEGVGGQQYARDTAAAQDAFNRAITSQQLPFLASKDVLAAIMGLGTGSTTTGNPGSTGLGGALGAGIGGAATAGALSSLPGLSFLGGPWGVAAGAGIGALASIFR